MFIHNLNPILFQLGPLQIRYYGLFFVIGFIIAYYMISYLAKKREINLTKEDVSDLLLYLIIGVIVGARILHVLYEYEFYLNNPSQIIAVWNGGLAFHGGLIGSVISGYIFSKKKKIHFYDLADITIIPLALALSLGRLGNFINGELYGRITNVSWSVKFPNAEGFRHPTQIYKSFKNFFIFSILWNLRNTKLPKGFLFWSFITLYSLIRFFIEYLVELDSLGFVIYNLTLPQIISLILFILGVIMLFRVSRR